MSKHLIVVCSQCKRLRTDSGEWIHFPTSRLLHVSHGLCPDCVVDLYPEIADAVLNRAARRARRIKVLSSKG